MKDSSSPQNGPYDLAVIGAGSAGFSAAITAGETGARVALIGAGTIGGTCVNVGCVPSKALIRAVESLHHARAAGRFDGIEAEARVTDWAATVAQKQALVEELRQAKYADVLPRHENVDYVEGRATFDDEGKLTVDGSLFPAGKFIIATGSRPHVPAIPGIEEVDTLDSTSALELTAFPSSMLVLGAGYIGVELAQLFARAGVEVTQVLTAERLVLATGRVPNSDGLNLAAAGITVGARGGIETNPHMRTTNPNIWAAGDVTGRDQFVYMAAYGAKIAARNAVADETRTYDNATMPWVVFSDPQVAGVGLSEAQARAAGHEVVTSILPLDAVPRALAARDTRGLIKLVAEAGSKRLLGAQIIAPEGADSIQTAAMALKAGLTYEELGDTIMPYLTTVEALKLAAQTFEKDVAALSCCAG